MKQILLFFFPLIYWILLCTGSYPVLAKAPSTAKIVYTQTLNGDRDIYIMDPDGSNQVNLTNHRGDDISPVWSPTGEQILFASDRGARAWGTWDLYLMNANGENVKKVFEKSATRTGAAWSPNGKHIAYNRWQHGEITTYTATIDGENEERLASGGSPTWSPDGIEIAIVTGVPNIRHQISLINFRTRRQKIFFPRKARPSWIGSIRWSPKGDKLAFSWNHQVPLKDFLETETIYTVNRDGVGLKQIVPKAGLRAVDPVWSPDGSMLLYQQLIMDKALQKKQWQIFKVAAIAGESIEVGPPGWYNLGDWFDPAYALPVLPQPHLLTMTWGKVKKGDDP